MVDGSIDVSDSLYIEYNEKMAKGSGVSHAKDKREMENAELDCNVASFIVLIVEFILRLDEAWDEQMVR